MSEEVKGTEQTTRYGNIDITYSESILIGSFAKNVTVNGSDNDMNLSEWYKPVSNILGFTDKIEGQWFSRWSRSTNPNDWIYGIAQLIRLGDRVYILHKDSGNTYLIEAQCQNDKLLIGKYTNLGFQKDTAPWVGVIVSPSRIDGEWIDGRWDLRRD